MNKLYKFKHSDIDSDTYNSNGKISNYLEVYIVATDEEHARVKGKIGMEYVLVEVKKLGKDWN